MMKYILYLTLLTTATIMPAALFAGVSHSADMMAEPHDPKKKKAGEECKASKECQRHHSCEKAGEKKVCVAPEFREIPNT